MSLFHSPLNRLHYLDDSGEPKTGLAVFGFVEVEPTSWLSTHDSWLELRRMLWREYGVPTYAELHTSEYVHGRGRISKKVPSRHLHDGVTYWKDFGRELATICLDHLRSAEGLTVRSCFRLGAPENMAETKRELYKSFLDAKELELFERSERGLIFVDGDGSDKSFRAVHRGRESATRMVLEDAIHLNSSDSHFIQMADLVAWTALAAIESNRRNDFAADWYETYLSERDPMRKPISA